MKYSILTIFSTLAISLPHGATSTPTPPSLTYLGTANITLSPPVPVGPGPRGSRNFFPITNGSFTGPLFSGMQDPLPLPSLPATKLTTPKASIPSYGGDWSLGDGAAGTFYVDARYQLHTTDGVDIYVEANGPQQPEEGVVHTRVKFETGNAKYYWLNNVVGVGIVTPGPGNGYIVVELWRVLTLGEAREGKGKGKGKGRK
ncbi:hypothetical protein QBC44DRAFT_402710 [Cladorrhinum sp. PSN332]|nr:hypothetical protein QBC44DRAFT_402710 [Cladorrhinum sp. PSN332]